MTTKGDLEGLWKEISEFRNEARTLEKYKGNAFYKRRFQDSKRRLNRAFAYERARISKSSNEKLRDKFSIVQTSTEKLLSDLPLSQIVSEIDKLELYWPQLEIASGRTGPTASEFEIPGEIPMVDYRLDLEEAIKAYESGFYLPALVMCRRAYETGLVMLYESKIGRAPVEDQRCSHCGKVIRARAYMGIAKLHNWAIAEGFVTERMKSVGFLLTDLGAGAAHPPLTPFKRDPEFAKVGIVVTSALLKEVSVAMLQSSAKQ